MFTEIKTELKSDFQNVLPTVIGLQFWAELVHIPKGLEFHVSLQAHSPDVFHIHCLEVHAYIYIVMFHMNLWEF